MLCFWAFCACHCEPFHKEGAFCHFEPLQKGEKSTQIKRKLAIFGYFACAQYDKIYDTKSVWYGKTNRYDKFRLSPKFNSLPRFDFIKVRNDGKMASFGVEFMNFYVNFGEKFKKFKEFKGNKEIE